MKIQSFKKFIKNKLKIDELYKICPLIWSKLSYVVIHVPRFAASTLTTQVSGPCQTLKLVCQKINKIIQMLTHFKIQ